MRTPTPRNFVGADMTTDIIQQPHPPAKSFALVDADAWLVDAAITPYCGCARIFDSSSGTTLLSELVRYFGQMIAPGAVHARMAITTTGDYTAYTTGLQATAHTAYTSDGGKTGNDLIRKQVSNTTKGGVRLQGFEDLQSYISLTGDKIDDAPAAAPPTLSVTALNRQFELQTLAAPYAEPFYITMAGGVSVVVSEIVEDLETL